MTPVEFRNDKELVAGARAIMESPVFQEMLAAMRSIHPVNNAVSGEATPHGAHIMLGEQTGWQQYENEFLKLSRRIEPNPNVAPPADYQADPEEEPQE